MEFLDANGTALKPGDEVDYWSSKRSQWLRAKVILIESTWDTRGKVIALRLARWTGVNHNNGYEYGAPIRLTKSENVSKV